MKQIYVTRIIPQDRNGKFNFSQIDDALEIDLLPYIKLIKPDIKDYRLFVEQTSRYLQEHGINEVPVDISSRLPQDLENAKIELELVDKLNEASRRQIIKDVSFSYGSVINHNEAYIRLNRICKEHLHPNLGCESKLFQIISEEKYLEFIKKAKEETTRLNKKAKELGLKIGPENMPCIDYAEIKENSRKQSDFERGLRFGNIYLPNLNNPGFIGCNPFGDLKYLLEDDMFLTLDTEHLNFSLLTSLKLAQKKNLNLGDKSPFLDILNDNIAKLIQEIPQEIGIVHLGAGFDLFYPHIVGEERTLQIASHFPFLFPGDFHKLSKEAQKAYLESVSPYFMEETETKRLEFIKHCVSALKQRKDNPSIVLEFEVGRINENGNWYNIYSGHLWKEFQQISKQNLESLL